MKCAYCLGCRCGSCGVVRFTYRGRWLWGLVPSWAGKGWSATGRRRPSPENSPYVQYTSRSNKPAWAKRGYYLHRWVWATVAGVAYRELPAGCTVHHLDGNSLNNCPVNLCLAPEALNQAGNINVRCPITGVWLTRVEYARRMGIKLAPRTPVTDWEQEAIRQEFGI